MLIREDEQLESIEDEALSEFKKELSTFQTIFVKLFCL